MPGKIKQTIDTIIDKRSKGSSVIKQTTRAKLIIKGINPDDFTTDSVDDPKILASLQNIALEMGVQL